MKKPRREDEATRLGRLKTEAAEARAADAKARLQMRKVTLIDANRWREEIVSGFTEIRAMIETALPDLVAVVQAAGDDRAAVIAARAWYRGARSRMADRFEAEAAERSDGGTHSP